MKNVLLGWNYRNSAGIATLFVLQCKTLFYFSSNSTTYRSRHHLDFSEVELLKNLTVLFCMSAPPQCSPSIHLEGTLSWKCQHQINSLWKGDNNTASWSELGHSLPQRLGPYHGCRYCPTLCGFGEELKDTYLDMHIWVTFFRQISKLICFCLGLEKPGKKHALRNSERAPDLILSTLCPPTPTGGNSSPEFRNRCMNGKSSCSVSLLVFKDAALCDTSTQLIYSAIPT